MKPIGGVCKRKYESTVLADGVLFYSKIMSENERKCHGLISHPASHSQTLVSTLIVVGDTLGKHLANGKRNNDLSQLIARGLRAIGALDCERALK